MDRTVAERKAAVLSIQEGWDFIFQQGALLTLFPIEDWLDELNRADTIAPILDPSAYRDYLYSGKGELIKDLLCAALTFKRAVLKAQQQIKANPALGEPHPDYREAAR
jgi:hypothetical protein